MQPVLQGRKRSGTTATVTSASAAAGAEDVDASEIEDDDDGDKRSGSADVVGQQPQRRPAAGDDVDEAEDEEDPEDSEVPWLCYAVRTSFASPSARAEVERFLLGKLSPAPHHPKSR